MIKSVILWALKVPALLLLTAIAWFISPVLALFIRQSEESALTGFPSQYPGKQRDFLISALFIWQTPDAPVDEWWYGEDYGPTGLIKSHFNQSDYESKAWLRWVCRIMWLCRNAAYGFGDRLGYDSEGMVITYQYSDDGNWNTGRPMCAFWKTTNSRAQVGWWFKAQVYFYKNRCLSMQFGYKLLSDPPSKYVAMQFTPFTKLPKD
jgi:hypothetical protein